jgi:hypothetical protein
LRPLQISRSHLHLLQALKITLTPEQMSRLNEAAPFDHGFPTQRFGLDPRLLPGQTPQTPLLKNVSGELIRMSSLHIIHELRVVQTLEA